MKCKDYRQDKDKRCCKHFLGARKIEIDMRINERGKYQCLESCKCRCALGKEIK